jgi:hypothetical protein
MCALEQAAHLPRADVPEPNPVVVRRGECLSVGSKHQGANRAHAREVPTDLFGSAIPDEDLIVPVPDQPLAVRRPGQGDDLAGAFCELMDHLARAGFEEPPVATNLPSGEKATHQSECGCRKRTVPRRANVPGGSASPCRSSRADGVSCASACTLSAGNESWIRKMDRKTINWKSRMLDGLRDQEGPSPGQAAIRPQPSGTSLGTCA